jgi:tripartite-type tricarboxylate transporter receptor subunit TctC
MSMKNYTLAATAVFTTLLISSASAQTWPAKSVRVIVPFGPGGGADLTARPVSQKLSEALGQQFVVDNRGGAGGAIGMELTAKAPPDGYTVMSVSGSFSATAATHKLPYDPFDALIPVVELGYAPNVLVVHPALPVKTTKELVTLARAKPSTLVFASTGIGGLTHMATELMGVMAGIKMIHVPYKSTGIAMPELMAGQTQIMVAGMLGAQPFYTSGRLRALAVTTAKRWPSLPDLPAIAETLPGYDSGTYYGMFLPKGTPQAIVDRLNAEVNKVLQEDGIKKTLVAQGMAASGGTPAVFAARVKKEYNDWVKVVREAKLKIE